MNTEIRFNQGYEIVEICTIVNKEIVIGYSSKAPNPYVCWYCSGGSNYSDGYYCSTIESAREKLVERYQNESRTLHDQYSKTTSLGSRVRDAPIDTSLASKDTSVNIFELVIDALEVATNMFELATNMFKFILSVLSEIN